MQNTGAAPHWLNDAGFLERPTRSTANDEEPAALCRLPQNSDHAPVSPHVMSGVRLLG
jgi:hypothetical protein